MNMYRFRPLVAWYMAKISTLQAVGSQFMIRETLLRYLQRYTGRTLSQGLDVVGFRADMDQNEDSTDSECAVIVLVPSLSSTCGIEGYLQDLPVTGLYME